MTAPSMMSDIDWLSLLNDSVGDVVMFEGRPLPGFPPPALQTNTVGKNGIDAIHEAFAFFQYCKEQFARLGNPVQRGKSVLDFGTGWGRVARCFIKDLGIEGVFGMDVTEEFVDICRTNFHSHHFIVNEPFPPTPVPAQRFDYIVAYSVFSHLSEPACTAWMQEFSRILTPGGIVAVTTRCRAFIDYCQALDAQQLTGYSQALAELFEDFEQAGRDYDAGHFLHVNSPGVSGGGRMNASFYGESFIPKSYAQTAYLPDFTLEACFEATSGLEQSILVFKKT